MLTVEELNRLSIDHFPGHLGMVITRVSESGVHAELPIRKFHMAPNGYLHAGSIVTLADTCAGYGCRSQLPPGATGFTTVELKCNFLGSAREGTLECTATPAHRGRTTQVWDVSVTHREMSRTLALFRCTQLLIYADPRSDARRVGHSV